MAAHARHRWATLAVLCVSLLLVSLDNTILNVALPAIVRSLHATSSQLQLIVDSYVVVFAGLLLVLGSLGDRVGRKWVFMGGLVVFGGASAASAFCTSPGALVAARAVMGVGAAAIMPSTLSILTNVFTEQRDRAKAIGIWSGMSGLGVAVGPVVGGWLLSRYWWGSVFLVNVPICVAGLCASAVLVPNSKNPAAKRPDPVGGLLSVAGMGLLLWGIIEAPDRSWSSPLVLGAVLGGAALLVGFVAWERHTPAPMLETSLFGSRRFSVAMGAMAFVIFGLMGVLFLLTQYLQFGLGFTALQTGLRIAPIAVVILVVAPLSIVLDRHLGTKPVVFAGVVCVGIGFFLLVGTSATSSYSDALPGLIMIGTGTGLALAPSTESVMGSLPVEESGVGSATNSAALQTGAALGVAVLGSLLNGRYQSQLSPLLASRHVPAFVSQVITGSLGGALAVAEHVGGALGAALAQVARRAFVNGMDLALSVGGAVVLATAVAVLALLPNRGDDGPPGRPAASSAPEASEAPPPSEAERPVGSRLGR